MEEEAQCCPVWCNQPAPQLLYGRQITLKTYYSLQLAGVILPLAVAAILLAAMGMLSQ